jgi:hypothetical protein
MGQIRTVKYHCNTVLGSRFGKFYHRSRKPGCIRLSKELID